MISDNDKLSRQHVLLAPNTPKMRVIVYGAGMLGSWVTHALARMVELVDVWDGGDEVEEGNIGNQAYNELDVGGLKATALQLSLAGLYVGARHAMFPDPSRSLAPDPIPNIVVACADSMASRRAGAEWCDRRTVPLFIDTRASGLDATIITVLPGEYDSYLAKLPTDDELEGVPCGATGTAFVGMFVAARVASIIDMWVDHTPDTIPIRESWNVYRAIPYEIERREVVGAGVIGTNRIHLASR